MRNHPFYYFFINYFDFTIDYISLHYPFTAEQVMKDIKHLTKGDAYYPTYNSDTEQICQPRIGLSFNKNMEWTDDIRALWGIWEPYNKCEGTEEQFMPLDLNEHLRRLESLMSRQNYTLWDTEENLHMRSDVPSYLLTHVTYPQLSVDEFTDLFRKDMNEALINPSIWHHTLRGVLTADMVEELIQLKREGYYVR